MKKIIFITMSILLLAIFTQNNSYANSINLGEPKFLSANVEDTGDLKVKLKWKNDDLLNKYIQQNGSENIIYQVNVYVRNDDYVDSKNLNFNYSDVFIGKDGYAELILKVANLNLNCDYNDLTSTSYNFKIRYGVNLKDILGKYTYYGNFSPHAVIGLIYPYNYASSWAIDELDKALKYNLITSRISPNMGEIISREEFSELVVRYYEEKLSIKANYSDNPFKDVNNIEILKAYQLGIIKGYPDKTFRPNHPITREDIAVMTERLIKLTNPSIKLNYTKIKTNEKISNYALNSFTSLYNEGIIKGSNGRLNPLDYTTRQEAVIILLRAFEKF
ncbi:MAG: S-layer homology domain-containing protein [Tissierellales bacterium]|nr:S-layer homology domain-containing protein [Tissierellales bacterium]